MRLVGIVAVGIAVILGTVAQGVAQSVTDLPVKAHAGVWELRVGKDAMSDSVDCIINVKGQPGTQVDGQTLGLFFGKQGGATSYYYRVDDQPMSDIQIVDNFALSNAFILMPPPVFGEIIKGQKVRVRASTQLAGLVDVVIDLRGLTSLMAKGKGLGCPGW